MHEVSGVRVANKRIVIANFCNFGNYWSLFSSGNLDLLKIARNTRNKDLAGSENEDTEGHALASHHGWKALIALGKAGSRGLFEAAATDEPDRVGGD